MQKRMAGKRGMSKLKDACRRLEQATDRLERAAPARAGKSGEAGREGELENALAEMRAENVRLREVNGDIAARLDAAIARLEDVLEG